MPQPAVEALPRSVRVLRRTVRTLFAPGSLLMLLTLNPCTPALASPPAKFTYQGNLRQAGFLVNGNRQLVFRLYTSSDAVSPVWTSPVYQVSVSTGLFRAVLEPAGLDWENTLWLELEVEGIKLSPREELSSSPYTINSYLLSGKKYTTSLSPPPGAAKGDLWMDTTTNILQFFNGIGWMSTAGSGGPHAVSHSASGGDPIISLGSYSLTGNITMESGTALVAGSGSIGIFVSTNLIVGGAINPYSELNIGGVGYSVLFASSVTAGWYYGDGSGLTGLNAGNISLGYLSGSRIGNVIVSTHIVDGSILGQDLAANSISTAHILNGSITRAKLAQDSCALNQILKWNGVQWTCSSLSAIVESDPYSIHLQDTLQTGATFYVSSGTVNDLNVNNSLKVMGTARIQGGPTTEGLYVANTGYVGVGTVTPANKLTVSGNAGIGAAYALLAAPPNGAIIEGKVGIGTDNPAAKLEVSGGANPGDYIVVYKSGNSVSAWLRVK